jgi:hypothetical protein
LKSGRNPVHQNPESREKRRVGIVQEVRGIAKDLSIKDIFKAVVLRDVDVES